MIQLVTTAISFEFQGVVVYHPGNTSKYPIKHPLQETKVVIKEKYKAN
jgi:hypothetical protein